MKMTMMEKTVSSEARALERLVSAAREVQAASLRLEAHHAQDLGDRLLTLELARLAEAMQELKDARDAFDEWMRDKTRLSNVWKSVPLKTE